MLGDVLLINDMHKEAARSFYEKVMADLAAKGERYRYVVGISGESGSGKSELAYSLGIILKMNHIRAKVIQTDNYSKIQPLLREEWHRNKGFEKNGTCEYEWVRIRRTLRDFKEEQVDKLITEVSRIDLLIVDGRYALKADDVDLRVLIDLNYHETKINQIIRMKKAVMAIKPIADLAVDKSYQVVTMEEHQNTLHS
jgi:uridine kinase